MFWNRRNRRNRRKVSIKFVSHNNVFISSVYDILWFDNKIRCEKMYYGRSKNQLIAKNFFRNLLFEGSLSAKFAGMYFEKFRQSLLWNYTEDKALPAY